MSKPTLNTKCQTMEDGEDEAVQLVSDEESLIPSSESSSFMLAGVLNGWTRFQQNQH